MNPPAKKIALNARLRWPDVKDNYVVSYEGHDIGTAWTRVLSQTSPDRLERAWEIEKSALARQTPAASANQGG